MSATTIFHLHTKYLLHQNKGVVNQALFQIAKVHCQFFFFFVLLIFNMKKYDGIFNRLSTLGYQIYK